MLNKQLNNINSHKFLGYNETVKNYKINYQQGKCFIG